MRDRAARLLLLNGGIPGSLTGDWLEAIRSVGPRFHPDLVLAVFFLRDGTRTASISGFFGRIRGEIAERNRASIGYRRSYLFRLLRDRLDRRTISRLYTQEFDRAYFGGEAETGEWREAQRNLVALRDRCAEEGVAFALVVFPILVELSEDYPFGDIVELVLSFADESSIPALDLLPHFRGRSAPDLWVSPVDQHPNERAHAIAADAILPFVVERLTAQVRARPEGARWRGLLPRVEPRVLRRGAPPSTPAELPPGA